MKMETELERCPFCGGKAKIFFGIIAGLTMVVCDDCKATVSFGGNETRLETIKCWNRRAKEDNNGPTFYC